MKKESTKKTVELKQCHSVATSFAETEWLDSLNIPMEWRQIKIQLDKQYFVVDAYDPETNTIYSFLGDYWHGNPKVFHPFKINKRVKKTFGKLYSIAMENESKLKKAGYNLISIWESDWKASRE